MPVRGGRSNPAVRRGGTVRRVRLATLLLITTACGKDGGGKPTPETSKGPERVSNDVLAAAPLQNVAAKAGGVDFTVDLPVTELDPPETKDAYTTWQAKKAWFDTPSFTVVFSELPMSPDETGVAQPIGEDAKDRKIVRAAKLSDGGYLNLDARNDQAFFSLEVCRPVANGSCAAA